MRDERRNPFIARRHIARRRLLYAGAGGLALAGGAVALARSRASAAYEAAAEATWQPPQPTAERATALRELVRCATLAASSHNTQPWRFRPGQDGIEVLPDLGRRCPAVDPDEHHLFVSLGCAAENIVQAAPGLGLVATPDVDLDSGRVRIAVQPSSVPPSDLMGAIAHRQCTRADYDGRPVPPGHLRLLEAAGRQPGAAVLLFTDRPWLDRFLPLLLAANSAQMADTAFVAELKAWIRFGYGDAVATQDGLFAGASGSPVLTAALGRVLFDFVFTDASETAKYQRQLRSSAGVAVFVAERNDRAGWVAAGRAYQRFALQATVLGLRHAFLNQPAEVPALRSDLAGLIGMPGSRPDLVVRFGYGPELPRSLRRPVDAVLT